MSVLISEPFENSLYHKLCKHDLGRSLIGLFLQLRTFYLGSLTTGQLIFTLESNHQANLQSSFVSLFYTLSVTSGIKGHQHLLSLCNDTKLALTLQKSDLLMTDNCGHVYQDPLDTSLNRLNETEPGRNVLTWIRQNNRHLELSPPVSSAENPAGFWHDNSVALPAVNHIDESDNASQATQKNDL